MNPTRSGERYSKTRKLRNQKTERHTPFSTIASALREHMQCVKVIQLSKENEIKSSPPLRTVCGLMLRLVLGKCCCSLADRQQNRIDRPISVLATIWVEPMTAP